MSQKVLKELVNNMKGKQLTYELVNEELKNLGFNKLPDVTISPRFCTPLGGWVELRILQNSIRITLDSDNIVIK